MDSKLNELVKLHPKRGKHKKKKNRREKMLYSIKYLHSRLLSKTRLFVVSHFIYLTIKYSNIMHKIKYSVEMQNW